MNDRLFACHKCRVYIDAGYRWAYWTIEDPGVVHLREVVNIDRLLSCSEYWNPSSEESNEYLSQVLPATSQFINKHRDHGVLYLQSDDIDCEDSLIQNWTEIETMTSFEIRLNEVHQEASGGSHVAKYDSIVVLHPNDANVSVDVISTFPDDVDPEDVQLVTEHVCRGAKTALGDLGATIRLENLVIHPVDFNPLKYEQYTFREIKKCLDTTTDNPFLNPPFKSEKPS